MPDRSHLHVVHPDDPGPPDADAGAEALLADRMARAARLSEDGAPMTLGEIRTLADRARTAGERSRDAEVKRLRDALGAVDEVLARIRTLTDVAGHDAGGTEVHHLATAARQTVRDALTPPL